jgi:hypothetical protein
MSKSKRIEELKSILENIEAHIKEDSDGDLYFDGEGWECTAQFIDDWNDEGEEVKVWKADDPYEVEKFEAKEEAQAWMVESIDHALSNELSELESELSMIDGIEEKAITITSINPQMLGWTVVSKPEELNAGGDIYAQTEAVNAKQVTVMQALEVYEIPAEILREAMTEIEVQRELSAVMTPAEIENEFGLAAGTVRQAIHHKRFDFYRKADDRTILIRRADAEKRWKPFNPKE